jgi:hypothetical protein
MISSYNCNHYFEQKLYDNYKEITLTTYVKKTHALLKKKLYIKKVGPSMYTCAHGQEMEIWRLLNEENFCRWIFYCPVTIYILQTNFRPNNLSMISKLLKKESISNFFLIIFPFLCLNVISNSVELSIHFCAFFFPTIKLNGKIL